MDSRLLNFSLCDPSLRKSNMLFPLSSRNVCHCSDGPVNARMFYDRVNCYKCNQAILANCTRCKTGKQYISCGYFFEQSNPYCTCFNCTNGIICIECISKERKVLIPSSILTNTIYEKCSFYTCNTINYRGNTLTIPILQEKNDGRCGRCFNNYVHMEFSCLIFPKWDSYSFTFCTKCIIDVLLRRVTKMWINWEQDDMFLYWIPWEVLVDIQELILTDTLFTHDDTVEGICL